MSIVVLLATIIAFCFAMYFATENFVVRRSEEGLVFIGQMLRAIFYLLITISLAVVYSQM